MFELRSPDRWRGVGWLVGAVFATSIVCAQKAPSLGYVYPPGLQAGTTAEVRLGIYDYTRDLQYFVHDESIRLTVLGEAGDFHMLAPPFWFGTKSRTGAMPISREVPAKIEVPADAIPGQVLWQVANANGVSATAAFVVGEYPDVVENRRQDRTQLLSELPVAVSGRIGRIAEVDRYQFSVDKNGPVTLEVMARRLGSNFFAALQVRDGKGRIVVDEMASEGVDLAHTFSALGGEEYVVSIHDLDFRGHRSYVYRLTVVSGPRIVAAYPAGGRRGETREVKFVGYGVATGSAELESVRRTVTFPDHGAPPAGRHERFGYHLETPFGTTPAFPLLVTDLIETVEFDFSAEGKTSATKLRVDGDVRGAAVTGSLSVAGQVDRYALESTKGQVWLLTLQSRALGVSSDVNLKVIDREGKEVAQNDDFGGSTDSGLEFTAPEEGTYTLIVAGDVDDARSSASVYRLSAERRLPSFELKIAAQAVVAPLGDEKNVAIDVSAQRYAGFNGEIDLRVEGLPAKAAEVDESKIKENESSTKIYVKLEPDASSLASRLRVTGSAKIGEQTIERQAVATAMGNFAPRFSDEAETDAFLLVPTMKAPLKIAVIGQERQRAVHRGTTYPTPLRILRSDGFDGPVEIRMLAKQSRHRQGIRGFDIVVAPGVAQALYPIYMPEWLESDRTSRMVVMGVVKIPDPQGNVRELTVGTKERITMILEGALLKLFDRSRDLTVRPGDPFEIPLQVSRAEKFQQPAKVKLAVAKDLEGLLSAEPVHVSVEEDKAVLRVTTTQHPDLVGSYQVRITATALLENRWPVISETNVRVLFDPET